MKPRTKLERQLVEWSAKMPPLTKAQRKYAYGLFDKVGYYWKKKMPARTVEHGEKGERAGIHRATLNLRSSHWAAESVVKDYGYDPKRTYVIEFGANIDDADLVPNE